MDEIIVWLQKFGPLIGGGLVPIGGLWLKLRNGRQDPTAVRSMKQHAKLHDSLPKSAREPIKELIRFEADKYAKALTRRGKRKLNGGSVAAFVFVALVTGGIVYGLITLALVWWPSFIAAGIVALLGGALLVVGGGQLFDYGDSSPDADPKQPTDADPKQTPDVNQSQGDNSAERELANALT